MSFTTVRQGSTSVDGHVTLPLPVVLTKKGLSKRERKKAWDLTRMNCFSSGFPRNEIRLSPNSASKVFPRKS